MKKIISILALVVGLTMFGTEVKATSELYFTNNGDRLYYDSKKLEDETFLNHQDMIPGRTYKDELIIKNGTTVDYMLYFTVKEVEQSKESKEFLDHIEMKIYIDDRLIYEGYVKGLDYLENGINLQNALKIGEYKPNEEHKMTVETTLDLEYDDITEKDASWIHWEFYAVYEEEVIPIEKNPNTYDNINKLFVIFVISLILIVAIVIIMYKRGRKA